MNLNGHDIGVCSWSLQPRDLPELIGFLEQAGLRHAQLALAPLLALDDKVFYMQTDQLRQAGIALTGGMINFDGEDYSTIERIRQTGGFLPDADWKDRKKIVEKAASTGGKLGLKSITAHVGFVPHKNQDAAGYQKALDRVRQVADIFAPHGIALLMETGQERAVDLAEFLRDLHRQNVFINFDPANMILYGVGDPVDAIRTLGPHIRHVHVKDATASSNPGADWGQEVPFGTGEVGAARFIEALRGIGYRGPLCIEREAGSQRLADVKFGVETLKRVLG